MIAFHDLDDFMAADKIKDLQHLWKEFDPLVVGNGLSGREWSTRPGNEIVESPKGVFTPVSEWCSMK